MFKLGMSTIDSWSDLNLGECFAIDSGSAPGQLRHDQGKFSLVGANGEIGRCRLSNFGPGYIIGRVGTAGAVNRITESIWASDNTLTLAPHENCDDDFAYYLLQFADLKKLTTTTAQPLITQSNLAAMRVQLPLLSEQRTIASVLGHLDTSIYQTKAIIEKLMQVKQGLLHDLLTRGIGANGELRPLQSRAPHLYKDSPLGWLPKEWDVKFGREVCNSIGVGIVIKPTQYYRDSGIPVFRSANVREHGLTMQSLVFMSPADHQRQSNSAVRPGDVLTVRTGYPGTSCVVDEQIVEANCVDIIISRPSTVIAADFWCMWINSSFGKEQVLRVQGGLAQQHFNVGELAAMVVATPPMEEQLKIVAGLAAINTQMRSEQSSIAALTELRAGLMDDLLTGRVRVTPLLDTICA